MNKVIPMLAIGALLTGCGQPQTDCRETARLYATAGAEKLERVIKIDIIREEYLAGSHEELIADGLMYAGTKNHDVKVGGSYSYTEGYKLCRGIEVAGQYDNWPLKGIR